MSLTIRLSAQRYGLQRAARVVSYLLLAAALSEECGYVAVWRKPTGALAGLPISTISGTGLRHARCQLASPPLRALSDLLRGHTAGIRTTVSTGPVCW